MIKLMLSACSLNVLQAVSDKVTPSYGHSLTMATTMSLNDSYTTEEILMGDIRSTRWTAESVLYTMIGFVGIGGNILVAVVILKTPFLYQKLMNRFILNQSLIDSVASLLLMLQSTTKVS